MKAWGAVKDSSFYSYYRPEIEEGDLLHCPALLPQGSRYYPLNRRLRGPKGGCVRCTEERHGECRGRCQSASFTVSGEVNTVLPGNIEARNL